ncbi:anaerobic glycerol-3-phosphate dehydrogenase subunit B [bacterium BFN5]|nr:anaerobic glycerol-3-phosphate dehydrogenase subunit B [bacterium BFN5]
MRNNDVIIVGGGLSGLFAAAVAAGKGRKVRVLAYGAGALNIGGGIIDVLGYGNDAKPLTSPAAGLAELSSEHPYHKIGTPAIEAALKLFQDISIQEGYEYLGSIDQMQWLPTAAGTLKPTCLLPKTMNPAALEQTDNIYVVGFDYLKDFYPQLVARNLQQYYGHYKVFSPELCSLNFAEGRDVSSLDIARWLDSPEGQDSFLKQLKRKVKPGSAILIPPVLGTLPNYSLVTKLEEELDCRFVETAALPPAVTGLRLRTMLLNYLKKQGVTIVEKALVSGSLIEQGRCLAVTTENFDRQRTYQAKSYIVANGGFYGGGLQAQPGRIIEPIFDLPVAAPAEQEDWANAQLFSHEKQTFAQLGIQVDETMRPLDADGNTVLSNVHIAGRSLAGYDFCFEKSGNGVALASAYKAAISL